MQLETKSLRKTINKAFLKETVDRPTFNYFKAELGQLLTNIESAEKKDEHEEHFKNLLAPFLKEVGFKDYYINTSIRIDLAIHTDGKVDDPVGVLMEVKRPSNKANMITESDFNREAMHEAVLYYLEQRIEEENEDLKHIVITDTLNWFVFDAQEFERCYYRPSALKKVYESWKTDQKVSSNNNFMYDKIADFIDEQDTTIRGLHLDLQSYEKFLKAKEDSETEKKLIPLFKFFSPTQLLKEPFANDSNTLNREFYKELLYILGLEETTKGNTRYIERASEDEQHPGSFIENAIRKLDAEDHLSTVREPKVKYGSNRDEQLFNVALELSIIWVNRVLFLKLLEAQLFRYHRQDKKFKFLKSKTIDDYDELNKLFFEVLARRESDRTDDINEKFGHIPYLNSSLFDPSSLEHQSIFISNLDDKKTLPVYSRSVLKDRRGDEINTLEYLFEFLDAYDFSAEGGEEIQEERKSLINASVLGLIFEKINGYKDGSFFTPGFITEYMARETLRKSVTDKFAQHWEEEDLSFEDIYNRIGRGDTDIEKANEIVNSITICDPAVGSGHFLVSCLNELLAIKSDLEILTDQDGKLLRDVNVEVENDELIVTYSDEELFEYDVSHTWYGNHLANRKISANRQRIQKALFHEKRHIIENCLFGVDINPNSVKICRLRLWIELLKNTYYTERSNYRELEVLPNIDINIKANNSLVSRFDINTSIRKALAGTKYSIAEYKQVVQEYKEAADRDKKNELLEIIDSLKSNLRTYISSNDPKMKKLNRKKRDYAEKYSTERLIDIEMEESQKEADIKREKELKEEIRKLESEIDSIKSNKIFQNAFEWRFEFPEVLNKGGEFLGFDVVIANPPYDVIEKNRNEPLKPYSDLRNYLEKSGRYKEVEGGKLNIYRLFIKLFVEIAKNTSHVAFITQLSLLADTSVANTRKFVFEELDNIIFDCFPQKDDPKKRVFEEAKISTVITQGNLSNSPKGKATCRVYPYNSFKDDHKEYEFLYEDLKFIDEKNVPVPLVSNSEWKILRKIYRNDNVKRIRDIDEINVRRGEINQTTYKEYITDDNSHVKLLKGVEVGQYIKRKKISQGEFKWFNESEYLKENNKKSVVDHRRIALQRITGIDEKLRLVGTIIEEGIYFADSTNSINLKEESEISLEYILGLLNSHLYQWRFKLTSTNNNVGTNEIEILPIIDPRDVSDEQVSSIKEIESCASQAIAKKRENPKANIQKIKSRIDRLIYEIFELDKEEIAIIEGTDG